MGDKTIPGEAPPSLELFYPPFVAGIDLPQVSTTVSPDGDGVFRIAKQMYR